MMERVLLTDAQQRKTLVMARSLGEKGIQVFSSDITRLNPTAFSRYTKRNFVYPNPQKKPQDFLQWLLYTIEKYAIDVLFPMDDIIMDIVMDNLALVEKKCRVPLPNMDSYKIAADKGKTMELARVLGVPCPSTYKPKDKHELNSILNKIAYPVVIKPTKSSGSRGIKIARNKEETNKLYEEVNKLYPQPLLQEYIPTGDRYDVCLLFNNTSQLRASFVQKEIRHYPLEMGPSTMQEGVSQPELVEQAGRLLKKLNWQGIAEIEFMYDKRDNKYKLMEINPRFWGSLYLSVLSGVDFPWLLYKLAVNGDVEKVHDYKVGLKTRWSLPGDILHFLANKKRFAMEPSLWAGKSKSVYDDIISLKDPLPTLGFFLACLRYSLDKEMWKMMFDR